MAAKKKRTVERKSKLTLFLHSSKFRKICAACCMLFAVFAATGIISFLISGGSRDNNILGKFGIGVAVFFTNRLFGIASLGVTFLIFLAGLRWWKFKIKDFWRIAGIVLFWMTWLSCTLGYIGYAWIRADQFEDYAGIGYIIGGMLAGVLNWGTIVVLLFVALIFLSVVHHVNFHLPTVDENAINKLLEKKETTDTEAEEPHADDEGKQKLSLGKRLSNLWNSFFDGNEATEADAATNGDGDESAADGDEPLIQDLSTHAAEAAFEIHDSDCLHTSDTPAEPQDDGGEPTTFNLGDEHAGKADDTPAGPDLTIIEQTEEAGADEPLSTDPDDYARHFTINDLYDPKLDLSGYQMPTTGILENWEQNNVKVTSEELYANKDRIVDTLRNYGIEITQITASPGPTVTLYEIKPAPGIRISKIKSLEDDIALSLSAIGIRIIAPIPGKGTIGIEVPNANPQVVSMRTMLESPAFRDNTKYELPVAIGKTISNEPFVTDLAKMPHLLMAGATGTGKSVGLNAVIASLLYKKHPAELKFVMVDPKKVELSLYNKIERHYLAKLPDSDEAIITDVKKVVRTLNSLCIEMDQRYDLLKAAGAKKITEYNDKFIHRHLNPEKGHRFLPYIVLVIDEFADLIMTAGKEVETPICRLAQLARAVGIHLIIATQRPTTNIITGTIKANFPARIAFKVTSAIDSRTILDTGGAQRLIGRGDMLISLSGSDMIRLQCALIETKEIEQLADFIGQQMGYPDGFELPEYLDEDDAPNKDFDPNQKDEFFDDAARLIVSAQIGSTSLLQRKMGLGYNRAGRVIDQLEAAGIVGPHNGSKPREVLVHDEQSLEEILRSLR